jgi:hypothetical protein
MGTLIKTGGIYDNPKTYDMTGNQFEGFQSIQKRCSSILEHPVIHHPKWLLNQDLFKINPEKWS